jgi:CTP synthase (UTP-ammonia lyase)
MALSPTSTSSKKIVNIAFVGKYTGLQDSYLSVIKSLKHSSIHLKVKINIQWIEASDLEPVISSQDNMNGDTINEAEAEEMKKKHEELVGKHEAAWNILKAAG